MFLLLRHDDDSSLVEVLDLPQLMDPFEEQVLGCLHAGEERQDPQPWPKDQLRFPSGESLPLCWLQPPALDDPADAGEGEALLR
jgi:hypothetical protein